VIFVWPSIRSSWMEQYAQYNSGRLRQPQLSYVLIATGAFIISGGGTVRACGNCYCALRLGGLE
jgi:hypothetical protein